MGLVAVLLCGQGAIGSNDESQELSGRQIFDKMVDNYASLASYQDEGTIITTIGATVVETEFSTRLARPDFYRIEWDQQERLPHTTEDTGMQGVWSFESGDYLQTPSGLQKQYNRDVAFANVASSSSGGVATVPQVFFGAQGIGMTAELMDLTRLADDKIGNIDCYRVSGDTAIGGTNVFWVGKRDFLIRQIRIDVGPRAMHSAWTGVTGGQIMPPPGLYGFTSIETYTNIVANKRFARTDFMPTFPVSGQ
jgi:hypothetical protein